MRIEDVLKEPLEWTEGGFDYRWTAEPNGRVGTALSLSGCKTWVETCPDLTAINGLIARVESLARADERARTEKLVEALECVTELFDCRGDDNDTFPQAARYAWQALEEFVNGESPTQLAASESPVEQVTPESQTSAADEVQA